MLKRKHDKIINIMQLRFFCQVALRGSVSRAADDLFRTQSAITRAIRDLEAALNVTLFERHYSGMVPTEYGKCASCRAPGGRLTTCRPSRRCCRSTIPAAAARWRTPAGCSIPAA